MGDKFASRHGQKGTVGQMIDQEDLPFTRDGTVPDILFNAHGIPSRMTMGQLWETVLSKLNALAGHLDPLGVPFTSAEAMTAACDGLPAHGHTRMGREQFFSGVTGEPLDGPTFCGIVYYQRLRHMVADKMHARSLGPVNQLVRQPTEGRARQGGLRIGEMERDCLIAHGASALIQERLLFASDAFRMAVCNGCGRATCHNGRECAACKADGGRSNRVVGVLVPYSFKLLYQGQRPPPRGGRERKEKRDGGRWPRDHIDGHRRPDCDGPGRSRRAATLTLRWGRWWARRRRSSERAVRTGSPTATSVQGMRIRVTPASRQSCVFSSSRRRRYSKWSRFTW